MRQFYFEKLEVWQKGRHFIKEIYKISGKFPVDEKYGMVQQIRRACVSVNCNISEGISRHTGKD